MKLPLEPVSAMQLLFAILYYVTVNAVFASSSYSLNNHGKRISYANLDNQTADDTYLFINTVHSVQQIFSQL